MSGTRTILSFVARSRRGLPLPDLRRAPALALTLAVCGGALRFADPALAVAPAPRADAGSPAAGAAGPGSPTPATLAPGAYLDSFQRELLRVTRRSSGSMVTIVAQLDPPAASSVRGSLQARRRLGSGIILDATGSIITTFSNIEDAFALDVVTQGGQPLRARLIGADHLTNIALLQVDGLTGRPARLGEATLITPGSPVVMVGGPQAGPAMSTFGAIEPDRGLVLRYSEVEMFRTNTPLFPGSIGGAIIGMDGRIVGLVAGSLASARTVPTGGLSGFIVGDRVSSAHCSNPTVVVPIEKAQEIAAELRLFGRVARGFLGVQMGSLATPPANGPGERGRLGVVVQRVWPGSPADLAGLRPGDRIVSYSGSEVEVPDELSFLITSTRPGSRIPVTFERNGQRREITVLLGYTEDLAERRLDRLRGGGEPAPPADPRTVQRVQTGRTLAPGIERVISWPPAQRGLVPERTRGAQPGAARTDTTRPNGH